MKHLGVDYGKARIGLAISDESGMIATPLLVIERTAPETDLARIAELVAEQKVERIVVGMPLALSGHAALAAETVRKFVEALSARVEVPLEVWDERLTTAQAERAMIAGEVSRKRRKKRIDAVAAQIMLQSYLDAGGAGRAVNS